MLICGPGCSPLSFCGGGVGGGGWCLRSQFRVQPNYSVEVVLHCVVVGFVTIHLSHYQIRVTTCNCICHHPQFKLYALPLSIPVKELQIPTS